MKISLFVLDAVACRGDEAVTAVSDSAEDLVKDFMLWAKDRNIKSKDIECALISTSKRKRRKPILSLSLRDDGSCLLIPVK